MIAADVWRMVIALLLPLVAGSVGAVYTVAFGLSAGAVFFNPASQSVPLVVDEEELIAGNSGRWTAAVVSQIALAPLAGGVVAILGVTPASLVNAATYAVSAAVLLRIVTVAPPRPKRRPSVGRGGHALSKGSRWVARTPLLRLMASGQALAALSAGGTSALLIVLATDHLGVDADGFGLLLAAIGVRAARWC